MLRFNDFEVLTFDCYGTLIDWESGLADAFKPVFANHHVDIEIEEALELYGTAESEIERGVYRPYREVLKFALAEIGTRLGFVPSLEEKERFASSVIDWPPFADSPRSLQMLKKKYKLAIISNIDDDLITHSVRRLGVTFDWIITAQQVKSYKPSHRNFEVAFERIGVPRKKILHVAQSVYHDIIPAKELGLAAIWVNRRHDKPGSGATPPATALPDLQVNDLNSLVERIGIR